MNSIGRTGKSRAPMESDTLAGFSGSTQPAYYLQFWPAGVPRAHVLYLPPFAEEMNRCRAIAARQARSFAGDGMSCTLLDFYGTGESPGELAEASISIWRQNIDDMLDQLLQQVECPVYLWGFRLGALLVLDYLAWKPGVAAKVLLWQPVLSGSGFVTQLLRQRMATQVKGGAAPTNTASMRLSIAAGGTLEVAGYKLGGELVSDLDRIEIPALGSLDKLDVCWLEHGMVEGEQPGAKASRGILQLQNAGAQVTVRGFRGDPVWQLHKRGVCEDLLVQTGSFRL